jgi:transmembrane protein 17
VKYKYSIGIAALIPWTIIEAVRLFYGYRGNLSEKVPDISSFLLISIFPQFPIVIFLGFVQGVKYPVDNVLGSIMIIFLVRLFLFVT